MRQFEWYRATIPHIETRQLEKTHGVLVLHSLWSSTCCCIDKEDPRSKRFGVFAIDERPFLITLSLLLQGKEHCCCKVKR
jgi:hypothetical protein